MNQSPKSKAEERSERFIETARQLGCDEDEKAFDEKLRKIAKVKPPTGRNQEK